MSSVFVVPSRHSGVWPVGPFFRHSSRGRRRRPAQRSADRGTMFLWWCACAPEESLFFRRPTTSKGFLFYDGGGALCWLVRRTVVEWRQ